MPDTNTNKIEGDNGEVVVVSHIGQLPWIYIPYASVSAARAKNPVGTIYHFKSQVKQGWQIIAFPIQMNKPIKLSVSNIDATTDEMADEITNA